MRRTRTPGRTLPSLLLSLLLLALASPPATAATPPPAPTPPPATADVCTGRFGDDARLGPEVLPAVGLHPLGELLAGWHRTGALEPSAFLQRYWDGPPENGRWKYPPHDGFAELNGVPDRTDDALPPGSVLDRFGPDSGSFLAPAGDPYPARSLPPQSLRTRTGGAACDYHVYEVLRTLPVRRGPAAPWFEQPGGGTQFKLDAALLDPGPGQRLNVRWLLDHGYLAARAGTPAP
ncbi:TNT domain-containing protein [Streptomyces sp. NPDC098789]|uniref:TNT domain-containing protein n=1 Tax=Streptomyces sp. NPDC098789 TaxID=3366098 RepID=UPI0037F26944